MMRAQTDILVYNSVCRLNFPKVLELSGSFMLLSDKLTECPCKLKLTALLATIS